VKDGVSNREQKKDMEAKTSKNDNVISDVGIINTTVTKPFSAAFAVEENIAESGESCFFFHVGF